MRKARYQINVYNGFDIVLLILSTMLMFFKTYYEKGWLQIAMHEAPAVFLVVSRTVQLSACVLFDTARRSVSDVLSQTVFVTLSVCPNPALMPQVARGMHAGRGLRDCAAAPPQAQRAAPGGGTPAPSTRRGAVVGPWIVA